MRNPITTSALAGAALLAANFAQATEVYVTGHEDDWQLFMGQRAFDDVVQQDRVVFIYVTAGDAGYGTGGWGSVGMYRAREEGAIASASIPTSVIERWFPSDSSSWVTLNRHQIRRTIHRNTHHYFLRLPNGAPDGNGYAGTKNQSLRLFRTGAIASMRAVDGSTTYTSFQDLQNTLQAILNQFSPGIINLTEADGTINPGSHSDHFETTRLTVNAFNNGALGFRFWLDYSSPTLGTTLATEDLIKKTSLLGAMAHAMTVRGYNGVYHPWHNQFLPKSGYRDVPAPFVLPPLN